MITSGLNRKITFFFKYTCTKFKNVLLYKHLHSVKVFICNCKNLLVEKLYSLHASNILNQTPVL